MDRSGAPSGLPLAPPVIPAGEAEQDRAASRGVAAQPPTTATPTAQDPVAQAQGSDLEQLAAVASRATAAPPPLLAAEVRAHRRLRSRRQESLQLAGRTSAIDWSKIIMASTGAEDGGVGGANLPDENDFDQLSRDEILQVFQRQYLEMEDLRSRVNSLEDDQATLVNENGDVLKQLDNVRATNSDLLAEQARMEEELAGRIEVLDKLRASVRELEREKRDALKRYREQADSFDSERQSWYDQEAHYKGRLANLATVGARRTPRSSLGPEASLAPSPKKSDEDKQSTLSPEDDLPASKEGKTSDGESSNSSIPNRKKVSAPSTGPTANELALQEQLTTLSTAHESLTVTLRTVQHELTDLKRVYQDLQEENESYEILLGEKTLNGEVRDTDLFKRSFQWEEAEGSTPLSEGLGFLGGLESVGEEEDFSDDDEEDSEERELDDDEVELALLEAQGTGSPNSGAVQTKGGSRRRAKKRPSFESGAGGGLDLAAELEMAQAVDHEEEERKAAKLERRRASEARKATAVAQKRKDSMPSMPQSVEELQKELKALHEANRALTLYVTKIVERVCSQEGFEKVLAVDYRNATPKAAAPAFVAAEEAPASKSQQPTDDQEVIKFRPSAASRTSASLQSPNASSTLSPTSAQKKGWGDTLSAVLPFTLTRTPQVASAVPTGMKPLRLTSDGSARKVAISDEIEDEDDIRERELLRQEMARIGISSTAASDPTSALPTASTGGNNWIGKKSSSSDRSSSTRHSVGSASSSNPGDSSLSGSTRTTQTSPPTPQEIDAEVQEVLQLRVVKEKQAKEALEQGKASGFTEPRRLSRPSSLMRHPSRSSVSYITGSATPIGIGLGIDAGLAAPNKSPGLAGATSHKPGDTSAVNSPVSVAEVDSAAPWGSKALRRLSMGWTAPAPTS
ncbi:BZ3500_MvSof-1268-A1-R1_Chr7-1g09264 [Microbotryum saponariae]|uniref:BZ3500_MvSof-1268-A1-R1_Chr7-1g09264 protein n=1 Tax=Microbotryum saponariae TaxID=289078 RepID=A0A2X0LUZ2_9BASI|nr:BZ3501_MvSof-1269-A2-R1_Chr7-1g08969 [Microbotryum saponariae]SDA03113.1 BZ3500_MvSof-1268-A1-R1_Chr7-1g09264 [Microbotryum saponariae]